MCPLRVILIFLSATVAGFFLLRGLNAKPDFFQDADEGSESPRAAVPLHSKVGSAVKTGFLRALVTIPAKSESNKAR